MYCIVSPGRTGSTLLATILAEAGADFDLEPAAWKPKDGAMEHPLALKAYKELLHIRKIEHSLLPNVCIAPFRKRFKRYIEELKQVPFVKTSALVYLVPFLKDSKIIILYRDFYSHALSIHKRARHDYNTIKDEYINAYATTLCQRRDGNNIVVSYDDIITGEKWATRIGEFTGIDPQALLEARDRLNIKDKPTEKQPWFDDEITRLERHLQSLL